MATYRKSGNLAGGQSWIYVQVRPVDQTARAKVGKLLKTMEELGSTPALKKKLQPLITSYIELFNNKLASTAARLMPSTTGDFAQSTKLYQTTTSKGWLLKIASTHKGAMALESGRADTTGTPRIQEHPSGKWEIEGSKGFNYWVPLRSAFGKGTKDISPRAIRDQYNIVILRKVFNNKYLIAGKRTAYAPYSLSRKVGRARRRGQSAVSARTKGTFKPMFAIYVGGHTAIPARGWFSENVNATFPEFIAQVRQQAPHLLKMSPLVTFL